MLDKLSEFFSYAIMETPDIEQAGNIIRILGKTKSLKAVDVLENFHKNPLDFINPSKKTIQRDSAFVQNNANIDKNGIATESSESIINKYIEKNLKHNSMRSLIKLKDWMGIEKSPEEQAFYAENQARF